MIETGRLPLRNWRDEDFEGFVATTKHDRRDALAWRGAAPGGTSRTARSRVHRVAGGARLHFLGALGRKSDGQLLGFCGLKIGDDEGSPVAGQYEVGWRLREDAWGQGYAKEAAHASLGFAFDQLGVERVVALTVIGNEPSWGLMERLGMKRRPDLDYEGPDWAETPVIVYMVRRDEWQARGS